MAASDFPVHKVMKILSREIERFPTPIVTIYAEQLASPYQILISTILSLRTQDKTTGEASKRLFELAKTPSEMTKLSAEQIAETIKPVLYYYTKAQNILDLSHEILEKYDGKVPDEIEELDKFKGVGRKTANLVATLGYNKPGICVDTHVHRITNRWGYVQTKNPDKTETALREILPPEYWIPINEWLVAYGQNVCKPISPLCSECKLLPYCARVGVMVSR